MSKRVELLSPAGNYDSFLGAVHAGADAVYLAGNKFGARAYADNFSDEEVCMAIRYAHLHQCKVYLTVNILLKEREIDTLSEYLTPFYQNGLDGVIVQDMGAFCHIKDQFPDLELHVSTQMAITGVHGAKLLKELGACRIVPARELSLDEIKEIKKEADIEIETFVHGALCYCYSGVCLFSSILGGRSGNRGRCAQPCRLPYEVGTEGNPVTKGAQYVLSLKDLCTIQQIPALIEAGIDSFKIEGRMKKPEYTAGVTALYRKYIDSYYANPLAFHVSEADIGKIKKLYIRSELQDGYYHKHNGKDMVTLTKPSYSGSDEDLLASIRADYIEAKRQLPITGLLRLELGKQAFCSVTYGDVTVAISGDCVEAASNRPLEEAAARKQMLKTGTSHFVFSDLSVVIDENVFLPVKSLNELRRSTLCALELKLLESSMRMKSIHAAQTNSADSIPSSSTVNSDTAISDITMKETKLKKATTIISASVATREQYEAVAKQSFIGRIYLSSDCFFENEGLVEEHVQYYLNQTKLAGKELYIALPYLIRSSSYLYLSQLLPILVKEMISGVLVRNLEEAGWLKSRCLKKEMISDAGLYCFNRKAKEFWGHNMDLMTVPYELNLKELLQLGLERMEIPVYGRIPMMVTANCIQQTTANCMHRSQTLYLKDRYEKLFPVKINCNHCFNVIYNSQPSSLHSYIGTLLKHHVSGIRMDFTVETAAETTKIMDFFDQVMKHPERKNTPPYQEYTKGHLGRGVE